MFSCLKSRTALHLHLKSTGNPSQHPKYLLNTHCFSILAFSEAAKMSEYLRIEGTPTNILCTIGRISVSISIICISMLKTNSSKQSSQLKHKELLASGGGKCAIGCTTVTARRQQTCCVIERGEERVEGSCSVLWFPSDFQASQSFLRPSLTDSF